MTPRRALTAALVTCVAAGLLLVLAAGRPWVLVHLHGPLPKTVGVSGRTQTELPWAVGWLAAAAGLAVLAVRGWWRVALGVVVAVGGLAAAVECVRHARRGVGAAGWYTYGPVTSVSISHPPWPWVAAVAAVAVAGCGGWIAVRGRGWPGMGEKYDAPTAPRRAPDPAAAAWDALDQGHDPTA